MAREKECRTPTLREIAAALAYIDNEFKHGGDLSWEMWVEGLSHSDSKDYGEASFKFWKRQAQEQMRQLKKAGALEALAREADRHRLNFSGRAESRPLFCK